MKSFLSFLLAFFSLSLTFSQSNQELLKELNRSIDKKSTYSKNRESIINQLKKNKPHNLEQQYQNNEKIYREFKKYQVDSAIYYVKENIVIAGQLKNSLLESEAKIQLANLYSSLGKYRESEDLLRRINKKNLTKELLADYYENYSQFYEHYATNSYDVNIAKNIEVYRDSLLAVLPPSSVKYQINLSQKYIYQGKLDLAEKNLLLLMKKSTAKDPNYAMVTYLLGDISKMKGEKEDEKKYYTISAITDIQNAIKDNAAIQSLALIYYNSGDIDNAYRFTKSAIEDAIFCKVKFRTLNMSEMYSIINKAYLEKESKTKSQLKTYLIMISLLTLIMAGLIVYIYRQMKKVTRIKEELSQTTEKLALSNSEIITTNKQLKALNVRLSESNHIKEEYIAYFFDTCSIYIQKLEDYRKNLNKKAKDNQLDDLFKILKSNTIIDNELDELYKNFDQIFLNLYPSFVKDFNSLLLPEEQIVLKQGELLNTELRIFALIRLGITDSVKIAAFLRYSLSTIYNYRTKTRNKAAVSRDEFENLVSTIGEVAQK